MSDSAKSETDRSREDRLEEQYLELAGLVGGLAHEIKNPLGTIRMNVQLLAEDLVDLQPVQEGKRALRRIETVQRECDRLAGILDDFLRFARVSELQLMPYQLNDLVEDLVEFSRPRIEAAGILLREDLREGLPPVLLDADLFRQALLNLLLNAEAVMKQGGELILRTHLDGDRVVLDVIDTGPGMSAEVLAKIFRPFFSTRPGGTGLGLPTTKRIIEAHRGTLVVDSEPGKGTAFHISLPAGPETKAGR